MSRQLHKQLLNEKWEMLDILLGRKTHQGNERNGLVSVLNEKPKRKRMYDSINRELDHLDVGEYAYFMNYGYATLPLTPQFTQVRLAPDSFDGLSHRLILETIGDCQLDERKILDIGCGRGGVAHILQKHFKPDSYVGMDISSQGIRFCRETHPRPGYQFVQGDAERLSFGNGEFDVVINIESSHCYPNIHYFYKNAYRVLKMGGWFLYTDIMPVEIFEANLSLIRASGFVIVRDVDITNNVLAACQIVSKRRLKPYTEPEERRYMEQFLAAPGSALYDAMQDGSVQYRLLKIWKPDTPS